MFIGRSELVLNPLKAASDGGFELSLHRQDIIRGDSLLPLELWVVGCSKPVFFAAWAVEVV